MDRWEKAWFHSLIRSMGISKFQVVHLWKLLVVFTDLNGWIQVVYISFLCSSFLATCSWKLQILVNQQSAKDLYFVLI